jgi:hypothetical protein
LSLSESWVLPPLGARTLSYFKPRFGPNSADGKQLPLENEVFFFRFDAESFWLDAPAETAQRFRGLIAARSRALDLNRPPSEKEHN